MQRANELKSTVNNQSGFSLLEMAIVITVIGLLAAPAIAAYNVYIQGKRINDTRAALNEISAGIAESFARNGTYPCPADPDLPSTNANHGTGDCAAFAFGNAAPNNGIYNGMDYPGSVPGVDDYDGNMVPDRIMIGAVPYASLGISLSDAVDSWGNKIMYAVSESMTPALGLTPADTWGAIMVQSSNAAGVINPLVPLQPDVNTDNQPDNGGFHVFVFSTGADGKGGYSKEGVSLGGCVAANGLDFENCNNDSTFLSDQLIRSDNLGANYYDDFTMFRIWSVGSLWQISTANPDNIFNLNPGNVGVGITDPTEKLHVNGNVKAVQVHGDRICDEANTALCFSPENIGGDPTAVPPTGGMLCTGGNNVMTGISGGSPICGSANFSAVAGQNCPPGQFVRGFQSDGTLDCFTP